MKNKSTKIVSIGWKEHTKFIAVGKLIQQGKARKLYYSCDKFYYEVEKGIKV
tara:strand:+ start:2550 stop:2705 length:156 start_codon:yes stop_codon:yes gene_type:complete